MIERMFVRVQLRERKSRASFRVSEIDKLKRVKSISIDKVEEINSRTSSTTEPEREAKATEIKGTTSTMNKILENFKNGNLRVILLNTNHAGSGIDISFASDIVIYHKMYDQKIQAIGRAYRVGRKEELIVHNLLYEDEYLSDSNTDNNFT